MGIPSTLVEALDKKDSDFEKYHGFMAVRNTFLQSYRNNGEYIEVVKELAPSLTKKDIADTLKLSVSTITRICNDNCIKTFGSTWTEFEVDYLIRYYQHFPAISVTCFTKSRINKKICKFLYKVVDERYPQW